MFVRHKPRGYRAGVQGALRLLIIAVFAGVAILSGCGEITTTPVDIPATTSAVTPAVTPDATTKSNGDDLDLAKVTNFLPGNFSPQVTMAAAVTAKINSSSTNGGTLFTSYERYPFPADGGTDAICYFFYEYNGGIMGGKFDYWRTGGQPAKGLENVHEGYNGHKMPSAGTKCWTMISSKDGKQRSNTCTTTWK